MGLRFSSCGTNWGGVLFTPDESLEGYDTESPKNINIKNIKKEQAEVPKENKKEHVNSTRKILSKVNNERTVDTLAKDTIASEKDSIPETINVKVSRDTTEEETRTSVNPCDTTLITFESFIEKACEDQDDGGIYIRNIKGGVSPYEVLNEGDFDLAFLSSDTYSVWVKDINDCVSEGVKLTVESKVCEEPEEYVVSVSQGGWVEFQQAGRLTIFSMSGQVVTDLEIEKGFKWYGTNTSGNYLPLGVYNYLIKGSHGELSGVINVLN